MNSTEFAGISNNSWKRRPTRKLTAAVVVAVSLMAALTAIASASAPTAVFSAVGSVLYAGPSPVPYPEPGSTYTVSTFDFGPHERIRSVNIITYNEVVTGFLGDGTPGDAVVRCTDHNSGACEGLQALLSGATATSVHTSNATLYDISESAPYGIPILSGKIRGNLEGVFTLSHNIPTGNPGEFVTIGYAEGTTSLRIGKGSTATYACFVDGAANPSLTPCIDNTGGMMVPIMLDVKDQGKFVVRDGVVSMAAIESIEGILKVNVQANLATLSVTGSIQIPTAKAELAGS